MIQINKQLQRPDKGTLSSGSIIDYATQFIGGDDNVIRFNLRHWFNQLAKDTHKEEGWRPVKKVNNFAYVQIKRCTDAEWESLNNEGSAVMVQEWLKELIDVELGDGFTEII